MPLPVRRRETSPQPRQPWDPFREIAELQRRMSELMDSAWPPRLGDGLWSPPTDVEETEDSWIVEAELPGIEKDAIDIELSGSELEITGEVDEREPNGHARRRSRRRGRFEYRLDLPGQIDAEGIEASLGDGVLTVRIPKPEQARPRRIEVRAGSAQQDEAGSAQES